MTSDIFSGTGMLVSVSPCSPRPLHFPIWYLVMYGKTLQQWSRNRPLNELSVFHVSTPANSSDGLQCSGGNES